MFAIPLTKSAQLGTVTLCVLHMICLVLEFRENGLWKLVLPQVVFLTAATSVSVLSFLEHGRNVRPSTILTSYLTVTVISDIIETGLSYVVWGLCVPWNLKAAIFATNCTLLVLESQSKRSILRPPYDALSPEETSGFLGVIFFWWINKVLKTGYFNILSLDDLPPLDESLDAAKIREGIEREWNKRSAYTRTCAL